jgi:hypothetical protein
LRSQTKYNVIRDVRGSQFRGVKLSSTCLHDGIQDLV